jgi:hypothetical protein
VHIDAEVLEGNCPFIDHVLSCSRRVDGRRVVKRRGDSKGIPSMKNIAFLIV